MADLSRWGPAFVAPSPSAHLRGLGGRRPERISADELESIVRRAPTVEQLEAERDPKRSYDGVGFRLALWAVEHLERHPTDAGIRHADDFFRAVEFTHPSLSDLGASLEQKRWAQAAAVRIHDANK